MNDGRTPAIQILLKEPLEPKTKYLVVLTDGIKGANGETIGQSTTYAHAIGSDEIVNPDLAPVRSALQGWQDLANGFLAGVIQSKEKSVFNYTFTTGGTDDVLKAMAAPGIFMAKQLPTIAHAEGAISKSVIEEALGLGADQATAEAQAGGTLLQIAQGTAMKINAGAGATVIPVDANTRTVLLASAQFAPMYYAGLITTIADGQGAGLDTAVDKPQPRDYSAIMQGPGAAVAVPYDTFFTAAVKDDVEAGVTSQVTSQVEATITDVATGEGAITASINDPAISEPTLDAIAGSVAEAINAEAPGTLPTEDGATIRPALKTDPNLQPFYLKGLQQAIIQTQVA